MRFALVAIVIAAATATAAWGQTTTAPAEAEAAQNVGTVTGTDVLVRSGPSQSAYFCAKISRPAQVTIVEKMGDWYKILPPPGTFSVVAKTYVSPDEGGQTGTITGDKVQVRAGGELHQADFTTMHALLSKGDKVTILGTVGDYYKIAPPKSASFYIADKYIKAAIEIATTGPAGGAATAPAVGEAVAGATTKPSEVAAGSVAVTSASPKIKPLAVPEEGTGTAAFDALEKELLAEFQKPSGQQDLETLLAKYKALNLGNTSRLQPYVDYRVQFLEAAIQERQDRQGAEETLKSTMAKVKESQSARAQIEVAAASQPAPSYAAQGILMTSEVFPGGPAVAKRYILRDPSSRAIVAYAQCTTGAVDLSKHVGQEVGVFGAKRYESGLGFVVEAQQVTVINAEVTLPETEKPTVNYIPPPRAAAPLSTIIPPASAQTRPAPTPAPVPPASTPEPKASPTPAPATKPFSAVEPATPPMTIEVKAHAPKSYITPPPASPAPAPVTPRIEPAKAAAPSQVQVEMKMAPKAEPAAEPAKIAAEPAATKVEPAKAEPAKIEPKAVAASAEPVIPPAAIAPAASPATRPAESVTASTDAKAADTKSVDLHFTTPPVAPSPKSDSTTVVTPVIADPAKQASATPAPAPVAPSVVPTPSAAPTPATPPATPPTPAIPPATPATPAATPKAEPGEPVPPSKLLEMLPKSGLPVVKPQTQPTSGPIKEEEYQ